MTTEFTHQSLAGARFTHVDLTGATFEHVDMSGARFREVDLHGATVHGVDLHGVTIRGAFDVDLDISGEVESLRVNGVDVAPYVEAELDRRHPDRVLMRPADADGVRQAWAVMERLWDHTLDRARRLDPEQLHESVNGEWSFIETLRHLAFATDAWLRRAVLGDPSPWHPLSLPWDEMPDTPGVPRDRLARPTLDQVLELRRDRMGSVRDFAAGLTDEALAADTEPVPGPGWPEPRSYPVRQCLLVVLNEEWWHRQYAERDLDVLVART